MLQKSEYTIVPIAHNFDQKRIIGELRILTEELPPTPNFVFSLGFEILDGANKFKPGTVPYSEYIGRYKLHMVAPVIDENYIGYLKQIGKI